MNVLKIEVIIWAPAIIVVRLASRLVRSPASGRADAPSPKGSSQHYLRVPILPIDVDMNNDSERVQMNLEGRAHRNVLIVAFANKLARIAWAVLSSGEPYRPCAFAVTQN